MNKFDQVQINLDRLWGRCPPDWLATPLTSPPRPGWGRLIEAKLDLILTAVSQLTGLNRRLVYANLKLDWFFAFSRYWLDVLGNRRLHPGDFYFLLGTYRRAFQKLTLPDHPDPSQFLAAWQRPETLYLLFHYVYQRALYPLIARLVLRHIAPRTSLCEFGCGLAPVTDNLLRFFPERRVRITAADLPTWLLHYTAWKYRRQPGVRILPINPAQPNPLPDRYDVITCLAVFEHLPRPLTTARHFYRALRPGGKLIFDYRRSDGGGLDSTAALRQRDRVLDFIERHFQVVAGRPDRTPDHFGVVVVRKPGCSRGRGPAEQRSRGWQK